MARIAILVEQQYQELEIWYPYYRLKEAGCSVTMVGPEANVTYPSKLGYPAKSDKAVTEKFVQAHLEIGIASLIELRDSGDSVKHLRFE